MGSLETNFILSFGYLHSLLTTEFCFVCAMQVDLTHLMLWEAAVFFLETHCQFF